MKKLLRVVGIDNGVLGYDSWSHPKITVQDLQAIRASPFWLESRAFKGFPNAIQRSKLSKSERVKILKEFTTIWLDAFATWPDPDPSEGSYQRESAPGMVRSLITILSLPVAKDTVAIPDGSWATAPLYEIAFRRMLKADPAAAPEIVARSREKRSLAGGSGAYLGPSPELLLMWAKTDLPGMVRWAEALEKKDAVENDLELAAEAKGLLMSFVDADTRKRWLAQAKASDREARFFEEWASWDPEGALLGSGRAGNLEAIRSLANAAAYGPWGGQPVNQSRHAFRVFSSFDFSRLPPKIERLVFEDAYSLMEQWDDMDVASAARFGFAYLLRTNYAPREKLIRFFSGEDIYAGEDNMIDRTFCALRVWAIVRPAEMKKWIATVQDVPMRNALTWLLEHPWGTGEDI